MAMLFLKSQNDYTLVLPIIYCTMAKSRLWPTFNLSNGNSFSPSIAEALQRYSKLVCKVL